MEHPFLMFLDHTQRRSTVGFKGLNLKSKKFIIYTTRSNVSIQHLHRPYSCISHDLKMRRQFISLPEFNYLGFVMETWRHGDMETYVFFVTLDIKF